MANAGCQGAPVSSQLMARALSSLAEDPDLRIGEVLGNPWRDLQERAVGDGGDALDVSMVVTDKLHVLDQAGEAVPAGKRGRR